MQRIMRAPLPGQELPSAGMIAGGTYPEPLRQALMLHITHYENVVLPLYQEIVAAGMPLGPVYGSFDTLRVRPRTRVCMCVLVGWGWGWGWMGVCACLHTDRQLGFSSGGQRYPVH